MTSFNSFNHNHHTGGAHPTFEALSSWRADSLTPDEAAKIQAHMSGCVLCRGIVADFATMEQALRRFEPSAELLAKVSGLDARRLASVGVPDRLAAIVTTDSIHDHTSAEDDEPDAMSRTHLDGTPVRARSLRPGRRSLLGGALAMVAILALSVGFLAVFHIAQPTGPGGAPTIISGKLTWRRATLPPGVPANPYGLGLGAAEVNSPSLQGNVSYLLVDKPAEAAGVWVTYDFTRHWKRLPLPPVAASAGTPTWIIDYNDAYRLVMVYTPTIQPHASTPPMEQQWVMFDTRAPRPVWRQVAPLPYGVGYFTLASWHTQTYEWYATSPNEYKLLVSNDEMRTFTPVVPPIAPSQVIGFWVQQATGQLLIEGTPVSPPTLEGRPAPTTNMQPQLWLRSLTDGRWAQIKVPYYTPLPNEGPVSSALKPTTQPKAVTLDTSYFVAQPTTGTNFSICVSNLAQQSKSGVVDTSKQETSYACSWDTGKHWQRQAQLVAPCRGVPDCTNGLVLQPLSVTPTGETLATGDSVAVSNELFVLPKNATRENAWEDIGGIPAPPTQGLSFNVSNAGDHAVVWEFSTGASNAQNTPSPTSYLPYYAVIP